ncbi:hypothetical protein SO802_015245 [Lithocarpus litseifolius]|uniref:Aminotransferase-like plant mobile domain-containing protein n=1 Tax=Lithocarpus litseifolius TaxID=425828 RepID=A0AAW2CVJ9_9ROSI
MASSFKGPSFLTFHGKKYDPTFDWHEEDRLLQDPRTHAPYRHVDTKGAIWTMLVAYGILTVYGKMFIGMCMGKLCDVEKSAWTALSRSIKNIINEAVFGTFFEALLSPETHEYKDLQLLLALAENFWDTTCTFHFPCIGEVMLTPYDFSVITDLRLGGERILVNDSFTPVELKKLLSVVPSRMRSNNIPLSWLCESIPHCETAAKGAHMFMLLFVGTFLCLDLGNTVNLRYLESLKRVGQIRNYDWGGMAYASQMHFMTQLSRQSLSSLVGAPFVWQVRFENFLAMCKLWEIILVCGLDYGLAFLILGFFVILQMKLDPWARCEGYAECEQALELNGCQALFECGHGRYWYIGDRVLPQVRHVHPPKTIPVPFCPSVRFADFLTDVEIAKARAGFVIPGTVGSYSEFIETFLQGCLVGRMVDVDLVEESVWMIGGLQSLART